MLVQQDLDIVEKNPIEAYYSAKCTVLLISQWNTCND